MAWTFKCKVSVEHYIFQDREEILRDVVFASSVESNITNNLNRWEASNAFCEYNV